MEGGGSQISHRGSRIYLSARRGDYNNHCGDELELEISVRTPIYIDIDNDGYVQKYVICIYTQLEYTHMFPRSFITRFRKRVRQQLQHRSNEHT